MKTRKAIAAVVCMLLVGITASAAGFQRVPSRETLRINRQSEGKKALRSGMKKRNEEPKGKLVYYDKLSAGTFVFNGVLEMYMDQFPGIIIWGENNKVYFKNLVSVFPDEYFVEGTLSGDIITVPTGQTIGSYESEGYDINFGVLKTVKSIMNGEEVYTFEYAPEIEYIQFKLGEDGSLEMVLPGDPFNFEDPTDYVAGRYYTDDLTYTGFGDFYQHLEKLDLQMVTIPSDAEVQPYVYIDEFNYAQIVDVAFYGDELYIRGLNSMLPSGTIRAKVEGNKAIVEQNEYLGIYFDQYYIFTKVLYENPAYDENDPDSKPYILAPQDVGFELNIDPETKTIYADKEGIYLSFHCNENDFLNSLGYYGIFELKYQSTFEGIPAAPSSLEYHTEWAPYQGFNDFFFTLSNYSTEGSLLDVDYLYYKVIVDGKPIVFKETNTTNLLGEKVTIYEGVPVAVELMPYLFANYEDVYKFSDNDFDIGIYAYVEETIGVQSVYYYNQKFTYSDIVTLNVQTGEITTETSGVESIADTDVVSTEYYTPEGRKVLRPEKGIYVKVDTMASGSRIARKIVVK